MNEGVARVLRTRVFSYAIALNAVAIGCEFFDKSNGPIGTVCEATRNSPRNGASAGRRFNASSAQIFATSALLFVSERCARIKYRASPSKLSGSHKYSLTASLERCPVRLITLCLMCHG